MLIEVARVLPTRSEAHRRAHGIPVEAETWRQIEEIAAEPGVG